MRSIYKILIILVIIAIAISGYFMYTSNIQNNEKNVTRVSITTTNFILPPSYTVHSNITHGKQIVNDTNVLRISEHGYNISTLLSDYETKNPDAKEEQFSGCSVNVTKTVISEKNEVAYWFEKYNSSYIILTQKYVNGTDDVVKNIIDSIEPIK